jgi:hypothetical protein
VTNPKACFNYRETRHFIANCPYKKATPSVFSNSVNGPKQMTESLVEHLSRLNHHLEKPRSTMCMPKRLRIHPEWYSVSSYSNPS